MINQLAASAFLASGFAIAAIAPAFAQIAVTGGTINFQGTQIYVPNTTATDLPTTVYNGSAAVLVRTPNIAINDNVLLRNNILPTLNTCACAVPRVGDLGRWQPTLSFVAYSPTGEPTFFRNIPATLDFRVDALTPTGLATDINRFESPVVLLTQTGTAANASSFGGVSRVTPVRIVEFGRIPSTSLQGLGIANVTPGTNYPGDIRATITGGIVSAPLANSFSATPPPATGGGNNGNNGSFTVTAATYIEGFNSVTSVFSVYGLAGAGPTETQPDTRPEDRGETRPENSQEEQKREKEREDDGETVFVDREGGRRIILVGLPSRVFPGMIGVEVIAEPRRTAQAVPTDTVATSAPNREVMP
jgi:hypothetical protein